MSLRPIVFLDIDGVLAHFGSNEKLDPQCLAELDWLLEHTGAIVLLTSSWREAFGLAETQRRLAASGFRGVLDGAVPCLPHGSRSDEIDAALAHHGAGTPFVILDDVPVAKHLAPQLVLVDDFRGLTELDVSLAARLLTCPRSPT